MKIKRPPIWLRVIAYLNRHVSAVRLLRKALLRIFHFQFDAYIRGRNYLDIIKINNGASMLLQLDDQVDIGIWWRGPYEELPTKAFKKIVKAGDTVIDVGANIGYYTILASQCVKESGRVFSFEPVSKIYKRLLFNTLGHKNITTIKSACGKEKCLTKISVYNDSVSAGSSISAPDNSVTESLEEIEVLRLDDYMRQKGIKKVDVVKIDVEGYEMNVLRGMEGIIRANLALNIFIEINKELLSAAGTSTEEIFSYLQSLGLKPWRISRDRNSFKLTHVKNYWGNENLILFSRQ